MKIKVFLLITVIAVILSGCGTMQPPVKAGGHEFVYDGVTYRIESLNPPQKDGYNILVHREGKKTILRAIDKDQDGVMDAVVQGKMSLAQAEKIYHYGINNAKDSGHFQKKDMTRVYRTADLLNDYVLRTYVLAIGETYNKLSIYAKQDQSDDVVVLDLKADGQINKLERGQKKIDYCQDIYKQILEQGLKEGKIVRAAGTYQVAMTK